MVIFASCDTEYYKKFGNSFINSAIQFEYSVHIHLINPTTDIVKFDNPLVTYTLEENSPTTREYYACNRFLIAPQLILNLEEGDKLVILDIDCLIRKPLTLPDAAVGLWLRESFGANEWEKEGTHVLASIVMYDWTSHIFAQKVAENIKLSQKRWFVDQKALWETYKTFKYMNIVDLSLIKPSLSDWEFKEDSAIWNAKGCRKENIKFLEEKRKYE